MEKERNQDELKFSRFLREKGEINCVKIDTEVSRIIKKIQIISVERTLFNTNFLLLNSSKSLLETIDNRGKAMIGRIDVIFRHNGRIFAGEIKCFRKNGKSGMSSFWEATKIIAYTAYYNWQNDFLRISDTVEPAILIPKDYINLSTKIIANKLGVRLYGIVKHENGSYSLELVAGF